MKRTEKKYKLKKEVKIIMLLLVLLGLFIINYNLTKSSIQECTNNGNSEAFCKYQLER